MSEIHDLRLDRLETDLRESKATLAGLVPLITRIDQKLTSELPHLVTAGEFYRTMLTHTLALVGVWVVGLGVLFLAYVATPLGTMMMRYVLMALSVAVLTAATPREPPYSCRLLYDEQRKCSFGSCDKRAIERLTKQCLIDGGRP